MNLLFCLLLTLIPIESLPDEVADVLYTYVDDRDIMSVGTTGLGPGRTYTVTLYDRSEWVFDELADICVVDLRRNDVPQEIIPEDLLAYIRRFYPRQHIRYYAHSQTGYEIRFASTLALTFDREFRLIDERRGEL